MYALSLIVFLCSCVFVVKQLQRRKTPDRRPNLTLYQTQSLWPDCLSGWGAMAGLGEGMAGLPTPLLDPPLVICVRHYTTSAERANQTTSLNVFKS